MVAHRQLSACASVMIVLAIVTIACGGVRGDANGDVDSDASSDIDAHSAMDADDDDEGHIPDDLDDDGVSFALDCNDCNSGMGPGFPDPCDNGFDEDCTGSDLICDPADADGDGHLAPPTGSDCDDANPHINPDALDSCDDGIAQNCAIDRPCIEDADEDHFTADDDCDDTNPSVHPWAEEVCDPAGVDEDCDGQVNEVSVEPDRYGCIFDPAEGQWQAVDFQTDVRHCGRCRNDCTATGAGTRCSAGVCE